MIQSVKNILNKIDRKIISDNKTTLKKCLLDFQKDLEEIKVKHTAQDIFDDKTYKEYVFTNFTEANNIDDFCKINLIASKETLDRLILRISRHSGGLNYYNIRKYREFILILISDLKSIVEKFEKKNDPNYDFVRNSYPSIIEADKIYSMSKDFLFKNSLQDLYLNSLHLLGLSVLNLRQSIEIRTKRAVGVYKVININKCRNDFGFKELINFIESHKQLVTYDSFSFDVLKSIYNWSSDYIHNAILPMIWQVEHALLEIDNFYSPGTHTNTKGLQWSKYGKIKIHDYEKLKKELSSQFHKCHKFFFLDDPDALVVI